MLLNSQVLRRAGSCSKGIDLWIICLFVSIVRSLYREISLHKAQDISPGQVWAEWCICDFIELSSSNKVLLSITSSCVEIWYDLLPLENLIRFFLQNRNPAFICVSVDVCVFGKLELKVHYHILEQHSPNMIICCPLSTLYMVMHDP